VLIPINMTQEQFMEYKYYAIASLVIYTVLIIRDFSAVRQKFRTTVKVTAAKKVKKSATSTAAVTGSTTSSDDTQQEQEQTQVVEKPISSTAIKQLDEMVDREYASQ